MCLIDDDGVVLRKFAVALQGVKQDSVGHHLDLRVGPSLIGEAHLIAN